MFRIFATNENDKVKFIRAKFYVRIESFEIAKLISTTIIFDLRIFE